MVHIKELFSEGNFTIPFLVHAEVVPGTDIMEDKKRSNRLFHFGIKEYF
jgi:hypothetical protein